MRSLSLAFVFAAVASLASFGCAAGVDSDLPTGDPKPAGAVNAQAPSAGCDMLDGRCIGATVSSADQDEVGKPDIIAHAAVSDGISPEVEAKLRIGGGYKVDNPGPRDWTGSWQKGNDGAAPAIAHLVTEGAMISGRILFDGSACFVGGMQVTAVRDGSGLKGTAQVGETVVDIVAIAGSTSLVTGQVFLDGKYTVTKGACAGERGTFAMSR